MDKPLGYLSLKNKKQHAFALGIILTSIEEALTPRCCPTRSAKRRNIEKCNEYGVRFILDYRHTYRQGRRQGVRLGRAKCLATALPAPPPGGGGGGDSDTFFFSDF